MATTRKPAARKSASKARQTAAEKAAEAEAIEAARAANRPVTPLSYNINLAGTSDNADVAEPRKAFRALVRALRTIGVSIGGTMSGYVAAHRHPVTDELIGQIILHEDPGSVGTEAEEAADLERAEKQVREQEAATAKIEADKQKAAEAVSARSAARSSAATKAAEKAAVEAGKAAKKADHDTRVAAQAEANRTASEAARSREGLLSRGHKPDEPQATKPVLPTQQPQPGLPPPPAATTQPVRDTQPTSTDPAEG